MGDTHGLRQNMGVTRNAPTVVKGLPHIILSVSEGSFVSLRMTCWLALRLRDRRPLRSPVSVLRQTAGDREGHPYVGYYRHEYSPR